jgi:glycerophosphoryl diester phosphodiesterase
MPPKPAAESLLRVYVGLVLAIVLGTPPVPAQGKEPATLAPPPRFSEHLIAGGYAYPYGIAAGDIDGDGDNDLTSADYQPHNNLYFFENVGGATFRKHFVQQRDGRRLERHRLGDIDGDNDLDIVIVKNLYGHILWFENSGQPTGGELWRRHVVTTALPGAYNVDLADFDADGDVDVAASSWVLGNQFAWFENDALTGTQEWRKRIIEKDLAETRGLRVADFDADGDADIFATAPGAGEVIWYENTDGPLGVAWRKHVIDRAPRPMHGAPADMDRDGDIDVVLALGMSSPATDTISHHVVWYENPSEPRGSWQKHVITDTFSDGFEAQAADLDDDGDVDVAATSWRSPGRIAWFENLGASDAAAAKWRTHTLKTHWQSANNLLITDLDGDGRQDLVAAAEHGSYELRWWRNEGRQPKAPPLRQAAANVTRTISHQGARAVRPANTLVGIRHAATSGVTTVEVDVRATLDGAIVLRHDSRLDATTNGSGLVASKTLAEVRSLDAGSWFAIDFAEERVPTLREALEVCRDRVEILLDLKEHALEFHQAIATEVRRHGRVERTLLGVRSADEARMMRRLLPRSPQLGLVPSAEAIDGFIAAGVQAIRLKKTWLKDTSILMRLQRAGVSLHLNGGTGSPTEVRELLAHGPASLSADHPERLVGTLRRLRSQAHVPHSVTPRTRHSTETRAVRRRAAHRRRRIIMNNDGNDARAPQPGTPRTHESFLAARATPLVGSQVDAIFYCTGSFGLYRHHSRLTELLKHGTHGDEDWAWELRADGHDALATMTHFAHRSGMELFWSMRMNDTHDTKYPAVMSRWKQQHPEFLVGEKGETFPYGRARWQGRWSSLDYEHDEVRERAFRILRDVAVRYDIDGIELDFFRHPIFFKPQMHGQPIGDQHRALMTSFIRRVRSLVDEQTQQRGRPLLLAIRIPDSLGYSHSVGLDVERWLQEDLIDIVTGGGYFHLEPWENLAALGKRYDIPVYACLSASRLGFPSTSGDRFNRREIAGLERWRGEAARAWEGGVSGIYIFNCFDPRDPVFHEIGELATLEPLAKTYQHTPGELDHWLKGAERFARLTATPTPTASPRPLSIEDASK